MTTPTSIEPRGSSLARDWINLARYYLTGRSGILALAAVAIVAGIAFNWSWLVATGLAPVLISVLPCAVMCGLGLCFHRWFGGSCASEPSRPMSAVNESDEIAAHPSRTPAISSAPDCCSQPSDTAAATQQKVPSDSERRDSHA